MKILIADDHALYRDGLSMRLEQIEPNAVILQSGNYTQTLKILEAQEVDLIILDLDMPDMKWEDGYAELKEKSGNAKFVIISASEDVRNIKRSLEMGAVGYIPKRSDTKILSSALKLVLDGGTYLPPAILDDNLSKLKSPSGALDSNSSKTKTLTARQQEVLKLVAQGKSNKQIAYEINVSEATVKLHINALLRSLGATNRTQAVITAQEMGLI